MFKCVTLAVVVLLAIPVPEGPEPVELFAKEDWYREQPGKEQDFVGILTKFDNGGRLGFGRFNPYRIILDGDKKEMREVYVGGKLELLAPYVGKRVKLVGKPVNMEVEGRNHREVWAARLFVLDEAKPTPKARRVAILADHKLYKLEPGQEKVFEGTLRKAEKGGYHVEMTAGKAVGKEDLIVYPDAGDPLAPFVGKQVRVGGKQVIGAVGMRTFQHTLPAWLEVIEAAPDADREALRREIDVLKQQLQREEQVRKQIELQFNQPMPNELAVQLKRQLIESVQNQEILRKRIAGLEAQLTQPGPNAPRGELEEALKRERAVLIESRSRLAEIQKILANIDNVTPAQFIEAKRAEPKVRDEIERATKRVAALEEQIKRGAANPQPGVNLAALKEQLVRQQQVVAAAKAQFDALQKKIASIQQATPEELAKFKAILDESQARIAAEQARLVALEAEYQRALQFPPPAVIPPLPNEQGRERVLKQRAVVAQLKAEVAALTEKLEIVRKLQQPEDAKRLEAGLAVARTRLDKEVAVLDELSRRGEQSPDK